MNINAIGTPQPIGTPQEIERGGGSSTASFTMLASSASALTSSDLGLISAATGATFQSTPEGLAMFQYYNPTVPIRSQDYAASLKQVTQDLANAHVNAPAVALNALALGSAEFGYAENFANSILSLRQSAGPDGSITPSMIVSAVKQSNANGATIPQDYVANAIGYLNGINLNTGS